MMGEQVKFLTRSAILAAQDTPVEVVDVPEWGGAVRVKTLTAAERDAFETEIVQRNGRDVRTNTRNLRARMVALTVVDEKGQALFSVTDVEALGQKSARAMDRVWAKASELAGMRPEDVEELAQTFGETPAEG